MPRGLCPSRGYDLNAPTNFPIADARDANSQLVWLLGQPHLEDYLSFVKERVIGGDRIEPRVLTDEWRAANDVYYELEQAEAGDADRIETKPIGKKLEALAAEVRANAHYRKTFDSLPTTIEMVELDRLLLWQSHVANRFANVRGRALGAKPTPEELFRFCLPLDRDMPPVQIKQLGSDRYQFISPSTDLRAQEAMLLDPAQLSTIETYGPVAAAIGLVVGFSANFLSGIRSENRILLHNGYHRAYALRALGITHAPCVIQTVTRKDELALLADARVASDPGFYFKAARPPMLRDFFNPALRKHLLVRQIDTVVEVQFSMKNTTTTEIMA